MSTQLRIARPVSDLARSVAMYQRGLGLQELGGFSGHDGFDGAMLGIPGDGFHLELTFCHRHPVAPNPTPEDLLVFYLPEPQAWALRCDAMAAAGFRLVRSFNPYWEGHGRTYEDPDGYRFVIQQAAWTPRPSQDGADGIG